MLPKRTFVIKNKLSSSPTKNECTSRKIFALRREFGRI